MATVDDGLEEALRRDPALLGRMKRWIEDREAFDRGYAAGRKSMEGAMVAMKNAAPTASLDPPMWFVALGFVTIGLACYGAVALLGPVLS